MPLNIRMYFAPDLFDNIFTVSTCPSCCLSVWSEYLALIQCHAPGFVLKLYSNYTTKHKWNSFQETHEQLFPGIDHYYPSFLLAQWCCELILIIFIVIMSCL